MGGKQPTSTVVEAANVNCSGRGKNIEVGSLDEQEERSRRDKLVQVEGEGQDQWKLFDALEKTLSKQEKIITSEGLV